MKSLIKSLAYPAVAVLSLAAAGTAFAADDPLLMDHYAEVPSLKTRAQVQAELYQARADGSIKVWASGYNQFAGFKSTLSRAEVRAGRDYAFDRAMYGEDSGSFALNQRDTGRVAPRVVAQGR